MLSDDSRLGPEIAVSRPQSGRPVSALLSDLASETGTLVRQEIALFKAELHEKLARLGQGAGSLAAGGLIAFSGWLVLLAAAVLGLSNAVAPWLAALIIGLVVLVLGAALLWFGKSRLDADALVPRRTLNSLREDEAWIRDQVS
jgi:Putative Actinobacterial Holin-X, holin superfamily III